MHLGRDSFGGFGGLLRIPDVLKIYNFNICFLQSKSSDLRLVSKLATATVR